MTEPYYLIEQARVLARKKNLDAEKYYLEAIPILEKRLDNSDKSKMEFWSTKAEYLDFKAAFKLDGETWENVRDRALDAIRYTYKCSKLNNSYKEKFSKDLDFMIKRIIMTFGCILPTDATHVKISCPIWLGRTKLGQMGISIGAIYDKAVCSICGLELLDENCLHELGKEYDGKICEIKKEGFELLHLALVANPKEPRSTIQTISYPKEEFYQQFDPEEVKKAEELGLPLNCSNCRKTNHDPVEITPEVFFQMQGLNIDIE